MCSQGSAQLRVSTLALQQGMQGHHDTAVKQECARQPAKAPVIQNIIVQQAGALNGAHHNKLQVVDLTQK
jgi:hypothetical protein